MNKLSVFLTAAIMLGSASSMQAADSFVSFHKQQGATCIFPTEQGAIRILADSNDYPGILRANANLARDIEQVVGKPHAAISIYDSSLRVQDLGGSGNILVGSIEKSSLIRQLVKSKVINGKELQGKREKYIITSVDASRLGQSDGGKVLVIAGSDKRGTEYGIYELSRQLGVSPWAWWADMPVTQHDSLFVHSGSYTDGEPVVQYRGLFLNDEAPCLSGWVNEKFPDSAIQGLPRDPNGNTYARGFNHNFYEHVFELLLRLKGNYLWPAMWGNAFYFDDPQNGPLADEMGIIMGTSHHEPMARNHQEWVRYKQGVMQQAGAKRDEDAPAEARWDYAVNQNYIDKFFREGIERSKNTEDLITIGMRGDGDTGMGGKEGHDDEYVSQDDYNKRLMEKIIGNQRKIIQQVTGKKPNQVPQMWALYKEVQHLYDIGLDVPEDVLIMLCDDNWGDIRRVPEANASATRSRKSLMNRKGGWGMYYHVDYVGAPRNSKWANVTNPHHLWEQMRLCYEYGIDRLWILNVGDLKPMEQPIDLFLNMAWNPDKYQDVSSVHDHMLSFCEQMIEQNNKTTKEQKHTTTTELARLMETYLQYNTRSTAELLTNRTYDLASGEWERAMLQYKALEADALRLRDKLFGTDFHPERDAHQQGAQSAFSQLVLYPIQSMANLYEMYYAQAMNLKLAGAKDIRANEYADQVERCFARDEELTRFYHSINGGKWNHLMDQTHIGYTIWQQPDRQVCPLVHRVEEPASSFVFQPSVGYVSMEAEHYYKAENPSDGQWIIIPTLGRTLSAVALLPHTAKGEGAQLQYAFELPAGQTLPDSVKVHIITNSTLPFLRKEGHRYTLQLNGGEAVEVNYNHRFVEEHQYEMYDVAAARIIETVTSLPFQAVSGQPNVLTIAPLDPGLVLEKVVIDFGGYQPQYLKGLESPLVLQQKLPDMRRPMMRR